MKEKMQKIETKPLIHVAFIMDGNGRWAKKRNLPRHLGHKEGCERIIEIYETCFEQGIKVMSLYAFSTENWKRPKREILYLFRYLDLFFKKEIGRMMKDGSRIQASGDISKLPKSTQKTVYNAIDMTKNNTNFVFNICLNYGGRTEIVRACKNIALDYASSKISLEDIDEESFKRYLYTDGLPDVDLLVRTSGEYRVSNFMPYQLSYAEFIFPKTFWPDFTKKEFLKVINEYNTRDRRFGGIEDEK